MSGRSLTTYLRTHRMKRGLSQCELGQLFGISKQSISRYELGELPISGHVLIASELIFDEPYFELFPGFCASVEARLNAHASALLERLEQRGTTGSEKVIALLRELPDRARFSFTP